MCRIDNQLPRVTDEGESKQHEIVPLISPPTSLPSLAHRPRQIRTVEDRGRSVELVAAGHRGAAVPLTGKVDRDPIEMARVGDDPTVDAQSCHSPIWKDCQPDVGKAPRVGDPKDVVA